MSAKIAGFLFLITVAAAAVLAVFVGRSGPNGIEAVHPARGPAVQAVYATGTVEPSIMIPVAPRISARLMELYADEGEHVSKDQILAQLEDEDLRQEYAQAQANLELAQKEYDRKMSLVKSGAASKRSVDEAKADLDTAQARLAQISANVGYAKLRSPENGLVIRRDGEVGELIPANQPVFWLSCCAGLRVSAEVDEEDIALVEPGQNVVIRADAYPGEIFDAKVTSITPKGDPIARSYRVRMELAQDTKLLIGMTAETNIVIRETRDALLVPASAVSNGAVWVVRDGKAVKQPVEIGAQNPQAVEIRDGIMEEDVVILDVAQPLEEGQDINIHLKEWKAP
jgi:multidrug efflux system membrane fusion protein